MRVGIVGLGRSGWAIHAEAQYHRRLFETLRDGAELVVTPAQVRRNLQIIAACHASAETIAGFGATAEPREPVLNAI